MDKQKIRTLQIDGLLSLLLFGVFAGCLVLVLLSGAQVYRRINQRETTAYTQRTAAQYLAQKLRSAPAGDSVAVQRAGDLDTLTIRQELEGESYVTVIYCYDGWLRELFTSAGAAADLDPESGEKLLELDALALRQEGPLFTFTLTTDGQRSSFCLALRAGQEAAS